MFPQIAIFGYAALALVAIVGLAWLIQRDATARDCADTVALYWGLGTIILSPVILPLYLLLIVRTRERTSPFDTSERWMIVFVGGVLFPLVVAVTVLPPDPFTVLGAQVVFVPIVAIILYWILFNR